jgi:hypothetical protein
MIPHTATTIIAIIMSEIIIFSQTMLILFPPFIKTKFEATFDPGILVFR